MFRVLQISRKQDDRRPEVTRTRYACRHSIDTKTTLTISGIYMQDLDVELCKSLDVPSNTTGVVIGKLTADSPAEKSGLAQGDVIQRVNGKPVHSSKEMQQLVRKHDPGSTMNLLVLRNGKLLPITVTIGDYPLQQAKD